MNIDKFTVIVKETGRQKTIKEKGATWRINKREKKLIIKTEKEIFRFDIEKIEFIVNHIFKDLGAMI